MADQVPLEACSFMKNILVKHQDLRAGLVQKKNRSLIWIIRWIRHTDVGAYQIGTPHVLSLAPVIGSLEMFEEAGIERIREKSLQLTSYMLELIQHELDGLWIYNWQSRLTNRVAVIFCLNIKKRHEFAKRLKEDGVIPDFRAPNGVTTCTSCTL